MKPKQVLMMVAVVLTALLSNSATAQVTSVADLEGVYTMEWQGYYWSAFGEWLGENGSTTVEIRAIEGTDSVVINNFLMDGCVAKAMVDVNAMTVTIPKQKISETILQYGDRYFDAIGMGVEDWDLESFVPSDSPLTGTVSGEKVFSVRGPMVLYRWNNIYHFNSVVEKIKLTYESPLPSDEPQEPVRGDVNGDGKVDISDVNVVINIMLGKE